MEEYSEEIKAAIAMGEAEVEKFLNDPRHSRYEVSERNKERILTRLGWRDLTAENLHDCYVDLVLEKGLDLKPLEGAIVSVSHSPFETSAYQNGQPIRIGGPRSL